MRTGHCLAALAVMLASFAVLSTAAWAKSGTFFATQTIPVPPASNYSGSAGGDGWAIALSSSQVFNVFHHDSNLIVACHQQSDASQCWSPQTVTDGNGNGFTGSGHPGMYLDQNTGKLYIYTSRPSDSSAGVVCFDPSQVGTGNNPFCGYTQLTPSGQAENSGYAAVGSPMLVGSRWYAFNYVGGANVNGVGGASATAENELLCFDVSADTACGGQPFPVNLGAGYVSHSLPGPATAAIGSQLIIPINVNETDELACWDASTQGNCSGSWPVPTGTSYAGYNGAPFPLMDSSGNLTGVCLPTGSDPCFTLSGASTSTPSGMTSVISPSDVWNGPALTLGPRVYVPNGNPNGNSGEVQCYDYSTSASCTNFPKRFQNLYYLYTVNPDPQRPTCIWVNAHGDSAQIQNFDAYTGGPCGQGTIRVLASQFVVNQQACFPTAYQSLQILQPSPGSYSSGSVQFADGDGNLIPGIGEHPLDANGAVDLTGLSLNTATGLPQFLITLNGQQGNPGEVVVKLTWTATQDHGCIGPRTQVQAQPTQVTTSLSGGGQSGPHIAVTPGSPVTDQATVSGLNGPPSGGTVRYTWYSDSSCSTVASAGAEQPVGSDGSVPASAPVSFSIPGAYYAVASYSGDTFDAASQGGCGTETVVVSSSPSSPQIYTLTVTLTGHGTVSINPAAQASDGARLAHDAIACHSTCSHAYAKGTVVTLTAKPASGSTFAGWSGAGCKGTGSCRLTVGGDTSVKAPFKLVPRTAPKMQLAIARKGTSGGILGTGKNGELVLIPKQKLCEGELQFIRAIGRCQLVAAKVSGAIGKKATGFVTVKIYSRFGVQKGRGKIRGGRWTVTVDLPGINQDPTAPAYLIVIHYGGDKTTKPGTIAHQVRIEIEPSGLGPI